MDVRCGQCGTDYDFDDALLSSRGTMVRCTTCGHQFKVFPAHAAGTGTDRWLIEKTSGQQLVFTSLKDLQRAIAAGVVRRQDVLARGGEVRQVGSIAELDALFRRRQAPAHDPRTLMGIAPLRGGGAGLPTREPALPTEQRPDAQPRSDSDDDEVTKVAHAPAEPSVLTPSTGVEIPELARATPPQAGKGGAAEQPAASPRATAGTDSPKAELSSTGSVGEAPRTPRSPSGPEGLPAVGEVPAAEPKEGPASPRQTSERSEQTTGSDAQERSAPDRVAAERHGRYAETLRSEESILLTGSSEGSNPDSEQAASASTPGAKPIARIATQRVAVQRERPGASTMRSSDWAEGSWGSSARPAASDDEPQAPKTKGEAVESSANGSVEAVESSANGSVEAVESSANGSVEAAESPKVGAGADEPQGVGAKADEPQGVGAKADEPPTAAAEPPEVGARGDEPPKVAGETREVLVAAEAEKVDVTAEESTAAATVDTSTETGAERAALTNATDAQGGSAAATTAGAPAAPKSSGDLPAEPAPQATEAEKIVQGVPHATATESAAASPAKPRPAQEQAAARDASKPSTARRPRPVSAEPAAQGERQRERAATATAQPRRARTWIGFAAAITALAGAAYLSAPIWLPPARPTARTESGASSSALLDARVRRVRELIDSGDLAAAKQQLDSALSSRKEDPRLLVELARWHVQTAELAWWRSRMYGDADRALAEVAREDLRGKLALAEAAVARAGSVGELPSSLRWARPALDRMAGNLKDAREQTTDLVQSGLVAPEYARAALAVAGGSSDWAMAAQQLGRAASVETSLGPSRVGLVFVLASSGRADEARAQLSAAARQPATEALFQELSRFLEKSSATASNPPDAGNASDAGAGTAESSAALDGDFRHQLTAANDALRAGQLARAERLFHAVLDTVPGNTEALSGLADVARARNDSATALRMYQHVLENNPGYLPALMALADQKWQSGDRQGASVYYKRVLEQGGTTSSYGARASQRLREMETRAGPEPVADAGHPGTPRSGDVADRPSPNHHDATNPTRDNGAQPSGRSSKPRRTRSPNPKDFVP
jgi:predicted Zn finger-like uncharacterized protein